MDTMDEDVSARVLLKGVLHTELPKTPITRSLSRSLQQASVVTRSSRTRQSISGMLSPQVALRKKMKDRLRESVTRPPAQQKKAATLYRKGVSSAPASPLSLNDDVTPRGLLRGILRTETESSLLVPDPPVRPVVGPAESSLYSNRPSTGTSDLDLPDLSTANFSMAVRGISRKRPQRNIDLSMFERGLDQGVDGIEGPKSDEPDDHSSSHGSDASSVLSLKTPHADPQTERRGLRRGVKRRAVDVDDFEQGVQNRLARKQNPDLEHSLASAPGMLSETRGLEKFTLGITDLSVSDTEIIMSSTALYPHPVSMPTGDACPVADKDTVTAMQIQRDVERGAGPPREGEQGENHGSLRIMDGEAEEEPRDDRAGEEDDRGVHGCEGDTEGEGLMSEGEGLMSEGEGLMSEGEGLMSEGEGLMSEGEGLMSEGEGLMSEGEGRMSEGEGRMSEGEGRMSEGEGRMSEGEGRMSEGEGRMSEGGLGGKAGVNVDGAEVRKEGALQEGGEDGVAERVRLDGSRRETWGSDKGEPDEEATQDGKMAESEGEEAACLDTSQRDDEQQAVGPEHVARQRAYHSEGGAKLLEAAVLGRGFRSLGASVRQADTESDGTVETVGASAGWHSGPEESSRSQTSEGSPPSHSPHAEEPHSRRASWKQEQSMAGTAAVTPGSYKVQDKENLSLSVQLESPEAEMRPPSPALSEHSTDVGLGDEDRENERQSMEESEDDGSQSEELSMKTPAFVRQKKMIQTAGPAATPGFLKLVKNAQKTSQAPAAKPKRKRQAAATKKEMGLPKSYLMSVFKHFAKTRVSSDVYPVLKEVMDKFFDRLSEDLEVYARHAKRKTIELEDVELLLRRQGFVTDSMPLNVLIERYLPREYRKLLIPVATSGNKVVPKPRR
ncbi:centromere protein T [Brienomyrus brachyistius]|uniref:centromere protein T n=1 Tax=Brienomyrus brachyistius TaxID=42636 RepID=UPI0020B3AE7D|nr:centromere protein T [Brienomyrus brachyistius]XP_048887243.1 centromere protein T [Brienomyrus brachyistius]XP_048887244.1 centromere protein T [Brienomyrus brachyistius]XP_048887245.1 centromere protein T [Brienomyrus brachyistius]